MLGQAPGCVRLEHVILQHEVLRVRPIVRDVALGVIPHHIKRGGSADRIVRRAATRAPCLPQEPVHRAAVDIRDGCCCSVRPATIDVVMVDERAHARLAFASGRDARPLRYPVGAGIAAEVRVERAVFLHDHDNVPDLVNARVDAWRNWRR
jgi:hypothetical protein